LFVGARGDSHDHDLWFDETVGAPADMPWPRSVPSANHDPTPVSEHVPMRSA
jgi:hypothetical protein